MVEAGPAETAEDLMPSNAQSPNVYESVDSKETKAGEQNEKSNSLQETFGKENFEAMSEEKV